MIDIAPPLPEPDPNDAELDYLSEILDEDAMIAAGGRRVRRCDGTTAAGTRCKSPALQHQTLCRHHSENWEMPKKAVKGQAREAAAVGELPQELVRSLRQALGIEDAAPVLAAFVNALASDDDKLRLTAATTITNAVSKIGETTARPRIPTTIEEVNSLSFSELHALVYMDACEATRLLEGMTFEDAVAEMRRRRPKDSPGYKVLREIFVGSAD